MNITNQRVLVTGGSGLIGSHIVEQLLEGREGFQCREVIVLDNFTRGRLENLSPRTGRDRLRVVDGDIRDSTLLNDLLRGVDLVFHQAAIRITQCAQEPRLALEVLVDGTFNVLEACVKAGVKKVLAASSASVYGLAEQFPTTERQHSYNNRTIYGAAKAFNEGLLRSFNDMYGLNYVAIRPFNVYGPKMDTHGAYTEVLIRWMDRIDKGQPPVIFGDGTQTMDFVYVEDVATSYLLAAKSEANDVVVNCGSGSETSLKDLAHALMDVMGWKGAIEFGPERKVNPVSRRLADTSQAEKLIGFKARVPLKEGLRRLVTWWREEGRARGETPTRG